MKFAASRELISIICVIFAATGLCGCSSETADNASADTTSKSKSPERVSDNADDDADTDVDRDEQTQNNDAARPAQGKAIKSITTKTPDTVEIDAGDVTVLVQTKEKSGKTGTKIKIDIQDSH